MNLKEWKLANNITWIEMAKKIGISKQALLKIVVDGSPNIKISTVLAIKSLTGLDAWDYLRIKKGQRH